MTTPPGAQHGAPPAPDPLAAALGRAEAALQAGRLGEASGICNDVLQHHTEHAPALAMLGQIAARQSRVEQAIRLMERAVAHQPNIAVWHGALCVLYRFAYRPADALAAGMRAIQLAPNHVESLVSLSLAYVDMDDRQAATGCLLRALGVDPTHAEAHLALAQTLLAAGDMTPGWLEYEWRNHTQAGRAQLPRMTSAPWNGMAIPAGRILLVGDQGYGDTIQFARYIPLVAERCQEVLLGCSQEMRPLLADLPGVGRYFHRWDAIPGHAAHCRLSSLPFLFGTQLDTIPGPAPYLFADPARVAHWAARLDAALPTGAKRIGLAWAGRSSHPNDRRRSVRLSRLAPLRAIPGLAFVSLQKPVPATDAAAMADVLDVAAELKDFGETAALISNLDLVITVDTAMAHLAGALGRPVWTMLAKAADWRWLLERSDTPWYPTMRLFRQASPGAWDRLIDDVAAALSAHFSPAG